MSDEILKIFDEFIKLENNVSDLYLVFHEKIPEDSKFWWQLHLEEKNHATLIKTGKNIYLQKDNSPEDIVPISLNKLKESNKEISKLIKKYRNEKTINREESLKIAYKIEGSAGEVHFQESMEKKGGSTLLEILQDLNSQDKNHALRIKNYAEKNGIEVK